ncbi:hypothetical protein GCM10023333_32050 [Ferrimonas pelagia]|uniref:Metallo-beta-lactamase domain-containing protein n=1 Tax=Ferrimonas pelagia TaxID=1177826 RepID=A0ABP9F899_9GAMM
MSASGYIRRGQLLDETPHWRGDLLTQLAQASAELSRGDLLRALVLADTRAVSERDWQRMRQAGLVHLLAISGLHLSIVAGLVMSCGGWLLPRIWRDPRGRGRFAVWLLAAAAVLGYGALAGFALPTVRAALMVIFGLLLLWVSRAARPWEILLRVAALILLFQPLAAMTPGYWLSFGAVSVILLLSWWLPGPSTRRDKILWFVQVQIALTLLLTLLQGVWFGQFSLHGIWTNLLLLPLFGALILPLCLLAAALFFAGAPAQVLQLADWALWPVDWVAMQASAVALGAGDLPLMWLWPLTAATLAAGLCWWSPWRAARWQAAILLLPLLALLWQQPARWRLDVIDVGQGLSVLVQRQGAALLYDTGARLPGGFSYAKVALLPLLRERGITRLDYLVISHGDNDHAGGASLLQRRIPIAQRIGFEGTPCTQGPSQWQGLTLSWFQAPLAGNDGSCVLLLEDGQRRVLLPGDIEQAGEASLLAQLPAGPIDLLLAPHHGSKTSSSQALVDALQPKRVVFPAGRYNRWNFPHPDVLARYRQQGAEIWISGQTGQLQIDLGSSVSVLGYRQALAPWWYNRD